MQGIKFNPEDTEQRFKGFVKIDSATGCWLWTGEKRGQYGKFYIGSGKAKSAHRFSYETYNGQVNNNLFVLHKCDNKLCVNPGHLFVGTQKDNRQDCVNKNRQAKGIENGGGKKLSEEDVINIKQDIRNFTEIARAYGVSDTLIHYIKKGKIWKHIHPL